MIINTRDLNEAKKLILKSKRPIIMQAQNLEFNRKMLEYGKFDILLSPESSSKKDTLRQKDSGLNEILGRIASKNSIAIGIDTNEISKLSKEEKAVRLEKIRQNIKICRKTKAKISLVNYKDKRGSIALLISLGASTQQAKEALI
jgi:ribonuclease P/MRP protein subunit RPP1